MVVARWVYDSGATNLPNHTFEIFQHLVATLLQLVCMPGFIQSYITSVALAKTLNGLIDTDTSIHPKNKNPKSFD